MVPSYICNRSQRGFYMIGLLLVFIIIAILYGKQLLPDKEGPAMISRIDQSRGTACALNRSTLATNLATWRISHMGEIPTIEKLQQDHMSIPTCPEGGIYEIGPNDEIYCSKHHPKPISAESFGGAPGNHLPLPGQMPPSFPPPPQGLPPIE